MNRLIAVLMFVLAAALPAHADSWALRRGLATQADHERLLTDIAQMYANFAAIRAEAIAKLGGIRQRQLLSDEDTFDDFDKVIDDADARWLKDIGTIARAIARNPSANCAEASMALGVVGARARQLEFLGRKINQFQEIMLSPVAVATRRRCRAEAVNECWLTGRYAAVLDYAVGESRQVELYGSEELESASAWVTRELTACARYELQFEIIGHFENRPAVHPIIDTTIKGVIPIVFDLDPNLPGLNALMQRSLESLLYGDTSDQGAAAPLPANPTVTSLTCGGHFDIGGGATQTYGPCSNIQKPKAPFFGAIQLLEMEHTVFGYTSPQRADGDTPAVVGGETITIDGADRLVFTFDPADITITVKDTVKAPGIKPYSNPDEDGLMLAYGALVNFDQDTSGDLRGQALNNPDGFATFQRGAYPVLFETEFTKTIKGAPGVNEGATLKIKLVHKPKLSTGASIDDLDLPPIEPIEDLP